MKKTILYLIRHSEKLNNYNNLEEGQKENEKMVLSVLGEKKAEELSFHNELIEIHEVWSSNYARAVGTAKYIAERNNLKINLDHSLNERKLRQFNGVERTRKEKEIFIYNRTNNGSNFKMSRRRKYD